MFRRQASQTGEHPIISSIRNVLTYIDPRSERKKQVRNQLLDTRQRQLSQHIINFGKIWEFYKILEEIIGQYKNLIERFYVNKNKDKILERIPYFFRIDDEYKAHIMRIARWQYFLNSTNRTLQNRAIVRFGAIEDHCIEANPMWKAEHNALFDQFKKKETHIRKMYRLLDEQLRSKKTDTARLETKFSAERLLNELIITKQYFEKLFIIYYIAYGVFSSNDVLDDDDANIETAHPKQLKLFEETIHGVINNVEDDPPDYPASSSYFDMPSKREQTEFLRYETEDNVSHDLTPILQPLVSGSSSDLNFTPANSVTVDPSEGSSSKQSILRYIGPPERLAPPDLHANNSKTDMPYLGGLKHYRSKRKLKTFRKRRNYKKTKRSKY